MIGLLTPFRIANYGTKLQAYAVQKCICNLGYDAQIIDFEYAHIKNTPTNILKKLFYKTIAAKYRDSKQYKIAPQEIARLREHRINCINRFDSHYHLSDKVSGIDRMRKLGSSYSAVLCGSDQIWNPVNVGSGIFLLEWVPNGTKKIAFAASFGVNKIPALLKRKYRRELCKFSAISVREDSAQRMVSDLGLNAEWILDPTLIVDKSIWDNLIDESNYSVPRNYIFCYFLGDAPASREIAKKIKLKHPDLIIVSLSHFKGYNECDSNFADIDLYDVGVADFVKLIREASYICTDSFHATAFSVIYKKEFIVCNRHTQQAASTNSRLHSFLGSIGAENRICCSLDKVEDILNEQTDYDKLELKLREKQKKSIEFLSKTIYGCLYNKDRGVHI